MEKVYMNISTGIATIDEIQDTVNICRDVGTEENIRSVRPGYGMHPKYLKDILGKIANKDYKFGDRKT